MLPRLRPILPAALAAGLVLALSAPPALAADGVLEINQTCATQTGCFAGDTAGYPVTISPAAPARSFRLTSDLTLATAGVTAIEVYATDVRIDLGGFTVRGAVTCSGSPLSCAPAGEGYGVLASGERVQVRNGTITGMGGHGVVAGENAVIDDLIVSRNAGNGISVGSGSTVRGVTASWNAAYGIMVDGGSVVHGCTALGNKIDGLHAFTQTTFTGNASRQNDGRGIQAGSGSLVSGNTVSGNKGHGIAAVTSTVSENTAYFNVGDGINCTSTCAVTGNTASSNGSAGMGDGIEVSDGIVRGNTSGNNANRGLRLAGVAGYRENVILGNGAGAVLGGTNLGNNLCNGIGVVSAACP